MTSAPKPAINGHTNGHIDGPINGNAQSLSVERAMSELRRGRAVLVRGKSGTACVAALETLRPERLERLKGMGPSSVRLGITGHRATALGIADNVEHAWLLDVDAPVQLVELAAIAGMKPRPAQTPIDLDRFTVSPATPEIAAGLSLAKHARLLPAVCAVEMDGDTPGDDLLAVSVEAIEQFERPVVEDLEWVSDAQVPLAGHEQCRLVLFRDARDGTEHVAVVVGEFDRAGVVPVRVHSACLTGDLLGSLRCDCGDQLRNAVDQLGAAGGGVLLYLAQEGRGIGLANKLRAYHLQDTGLDTLDADHELGFRSDERSFTMAALMLRKLGVLRIQLLTNNPSKFRQLQDAGIEVVGRLSLGGAVNEYNARYIRAKQERAGHLPVEE